LWQRVDAAKNAVIHAGWNLPPVQSPILPLLIGPEDTAVAIANGLREDGLLLPAIRFPTVARGAARLRLTVTAAHSAEDIEILGKALSSRAPR
jgi:7-keto-8-aminopelargonate synthetase-like enzyme